MLAELVQTLFKNGVELADARHKASERVSLHPTGRAGEMILMTPGEPNLTVAATQKAVQTVELCDLTAAVQELHATWPTDVIGVVATSPVFVALKTGARLTFDTHELLTRLTSPLRLSEAWTRLPTLAEPIDPRDLLKLFTLHYRSGFNESGWKRFREAFRSLQAYRKQTKVSSAAGYDRQVQNEIKFGEGGHSIDDFEILTIDIPVLNVPGLQFKPARVELTLNIDPDSVTVGYEASADEMRRAEDDAVAQVVAYLRDAFRKAEIPTPVLTGDGSLVFADMPPKS